MSGGDNWATGAAYEPYVGRWSRLVARAFVPWLGARRDGHWLDVGCGTGALTRAVLDLAAPASVLGVDPSPGFLAYARGQTPDPRARFEAGNAEALPADDESCDAVVSGLVLNFVPDPARAVTDMQRVVRRGGMVGAYVWDYADGMQLIRRCWDAAAAGDPAAAALDEGRRFPLCRPAALRELWADAGLRDIEVQAIDVPTVFASFADYWEPFLGGQGPAPTYVAALSEPRREALRDHLQASLPTAADGSIALSARAWAIRAHS